MLSNDDLNLRCFSREFPNINLIILVWLSSMLAACGSATPPNTPAPTIAPPSPAPSATSPAPTRSPALTPVSPTQAPTNAPRPAPTRADPLAQVPACPAGLNAPLFNTLPIDPNDFIAFRPLGFLSPPIHIFPAKHSAFAMTPPGQKPVAKPVKAPGKVWVTEIWEATFSSGGANYQVFAYPCRDVRVYFGHVATLTDKLLTEFKRSAPQCNSFAEGTATVTTCRRDGLSLLLEAGEPLGAGPDTAGVDFGVVDFRRPPAAFINLDHYDRYYPYYASPLDYFTPETRKTLASKTGSVFGNKFRTVEPIGGVYMQDLPDTAQGNWFFPGTYHRNSTDLSPSLGLAHDYVNPAQPIMALGNSVKGVTMGLYTFKLETTGLLNRDFSAVKADGQTYCYDQFLQGQTDGGMPLGKLNGILILTMPTSTTLKLELLAGSSCQAATNRTFTANATSFER